MESLTYPSAYFNDGGVDTQQVYIAYDQLGMIIGVYRCIETAIDKVLRLKCQRTYSIRFMLKYLMIHIC